jgi:hypothetical protein
MDKALLHILQHALGLDEYGQGRQYRNHFVAGGKDLDYCRQLVGMGYMKEHPATAISGGNPWFSVTPAGIDAVAQFSPEPPKLTRAQKRYRDHLHADAGLTFAEGLGIKVPDVEFERRWIGSDYKDGKWTKGRSECRWRYRRTIRYRWGMDAIEGEWKPTKKEAKASYKAALQRRRQQDNQATQAVA